MCLLVVKPSGASLPDDWEEICRRAAATNPHGSGYCTAKAMWKSPDVDYKRFASLTHAIATVDDPMIIHWRLSTSGVINHQNCHPFQIEDGTRFAHNGIIDIEYPPTKKFSDTAQLAFASKTFEELMDRCGKVTDSFNKFAILNRDENEVYIWGINYGDWRDDLWYSNMYWDREPYTPETFVWDVEDYDLQAQLAEMITTHGWKKIVQCLREIKELEDVANNEG